MCFDKRKSSHINVKCFTEHRNEHFFFLSFFLFYLFSFIFFFFFLFSVFLFSFLFVPKRATNRVFAILILLHLLS